MNKIVLEKNYIIEKNIDNSIKVSLEEMDKFFDVKTLNVDILKDTNLKIIQKNDEKIKLDINII